MKARDIREALRTKGFHEDRSRDHCYYFLHYNGKKSSVFTKISHSEREIKAPLLSVMARQLKITKAQFSELVICTLRGDEYAALLIAQRIIGDPPQYPVSN
jgi:predicted RNA binding protein YcfA (HicA-like mRNA interferase family)